jgi:oxygen-independent coproporphyrinogen-3 oxidase
VRRSNHRSTARYLKAVLQGNSPISECDPLTDKEKAHEHLVFGLRRMEGIDRGTFVVATGFSVDELVGSQLRWLVGEGLLHSDDERIRLTRKGLLVSDSIWPHLL